MNRTKCTSNNSSSILIIVFVFWVTLLHWAKKHSVNNNVKTHGWINLNCLYLQPYFNNIQTTVAHFFFQNPGVKCSSATFDKKITEYYYSLQFFKAFQCVWYWSFKSCQLKSSILPRIKNRMPWILCFFFNTDIWQKWRLRCISQSTWTKMTWTRPV